jgi:hypothetical protein
MSDITLQLEYSVEVDASPAFARFALDGPFEVGSRGTTLVPGQDASLRYWTAEPDSQNVRSRKAVLSGSSLVGGGLLVQATGAYLGNDKRGRQGEMED